VRRLRDIFKSIYGVVTGDDITYVWCSHCGVRLHLTNTNSRLFPLWIHARKGRGSEMCFSILIWRIEGDDGGDDGRHSVTSPHETYREMSLQKIYKKIWNLSIVRRKCLRSVFLAALFLRSNLLNAKSFRSPFMCTLLPSLSVYASFIV